MDSIFKGRLEKIMIKRQVAHNMQHVANFKNRYTVGCSKTNTHTPTHMQVCLILRKELMVIMSFKK
jgi:hypothetical protein